MLKILIVLMSISATAFAEPQVIVGQHGFSVVSQQGSTTYVTGQQPQNIAIPVQVNPVTGIGQVHTPQGSYIVSRQGSTTTVIQTAKSR